MKYIIEPHCHCKETSSCSHIGGAELVRLYKSKNYDAIMITDHYYSGFFDSYRKNDKSILWDELADNYLKGYRTAKKEGDNIGVAVLLGIELRFRENSNDYLVFGITEEIIYKYPDLYEYTPEKFIEFSRSHGLIIIQAHPFRDGMVQRDSRFLDGIEIYNGHPWHNSRNHLARELYESIAQNQKREYIKIAGSDCHEIGHEATAGIISDILPQNSVELKNLIVSGNYGIYIK
ncbi:MAG: transposase [Oscillospiraceae bacterium]|nr:transposase [Oscillospiraceae bacterium]